MFTLWLKRIIKDYVSQRPGFEEDKIKFAYFPALAACKLEGGNVLKYGELAMKDIGLAGDHNGEHAQIVWAYGNLGDTVNWLKTLKEGSSLSTVDYYYNKLRTTTI